MKKRRRLIIFLVVLAILLGTGYFVYRAVMPKMIAKALISEEVPPYVPKRFKSNLEEIREPVGKGAEAILLKMKEAGISLQDLLDAIDNITEPQAYAFLDEVNATEPTETDEIFDLALKHFPTKFDAEVFREPVKKSFKFRQILNAIDFGNTNRRTRDVDFSTIKAVAKIIVTEKAKELGLTQ
jgi:hypothetical protein